MLGTSNQSVPEMAIDHVKEMLVKHHCQPFLSRQARSRPNPKATKGPLKEVFGVHGVSISGLEVKKRMLSWNRGIYDNVIIIYIYI